MRSTHLFTLLIPCLLFISCANNSAHNKDQAENKQAQTGDSGKTAPKQSPATETAKTDSEQPPAENNPKTVQTETDTKNATGTIKVLSAMKDFSGETVKSIYAEQCRSWSLTVAQIESIINDFKPVSASQYESYTSLPCQMIGELRMDGVRYRYQLNAGSTLLLKTNADTRYFVCSTGNCGRLLLKQ